jgi:hypothetical protein
MVIKLEDKIKESIVKPGDIIFYKEITKTISPLAGKIKLRGGHGYGIMLGACPETGPAPSVAELRVTMTRIGICALDDVIEFLGQENFQKLVTGMALKYIPRPKRATGTPASVNGHELKPENNADDSAVYANGTPDVTGPIPIASDTTYPIKG